MPYDAAIAEFQTLERLQQALPHILDAPKDQGRVELLVARGPGGSRETPERARSSDV